MSCLLDKYTKEELETIVQESKNYKEILTKVGYTTYGGRNTDTLKKYLEKYNISIDHFTSCANPILRTKENVFCKDSTASQATLRRWYLKENIEYKCEICGNNGVWNEKELTLQLDHKDGDNHNNELSNLRWLCPNCHSQTKTWAGKGTNKPTPEYLIKNNKNRIKKVSSNNIIISNYCVDCGKEISHGAIRCPECHALYSRKVERPSAEQLSKELWETNFTQVGKKYGVTDNTVRKWCKAYGMSTKAGDYQTSKDKKEQYQYEVQQIDINTGEVIATFKSCREAERITKIYHINDACNPNNSRKTAGGYKWVRSKKTLLNKK